MDVVAGFGKESMLRAGSLGKGHKHGSAKPAWTAATQAPLAALEAKFGNDAPTAKVAIPANTLLHC